MRASVTTVALFAGLIIPSAMGDESGASKQEQPDVRPLKTDPDELPPGIRNFNGMLVGRLAAKDVERGAFVVKVDAVPRVWRNSRAENPKGIVGKTIEVVGVNGRFLDVLVVSRVGETLEFECQHDGERLRFPGEMLRKVAPYDPADYPELPEAFRGFRGAVAATIKKKDPETFELIIEVHRVLDTWKENQARDAESIVGRQLMLAGFWNRKETYHDLKVGDQIEVGMQHIGLRSEHLNMAEFVRRQKEQTAAAEMRRESAPPSEGMSPQQRGFRGMLVGRLMKKDIERGTFTVEVDAVPRVWKNNSADRPKGFIGDQVNASGLSGKLLDVLVVTRVGETLEFGAFHEGGDSVRVVELLRKVPPVKEGDYPELPESFRGFRGMLRGEIVRKGDQLLDLIVKVSAVQSAFAENQASNAESIVGKPITLTGFWRRRRNFRNCELAMLSNSEQNISSDSVII